jgi:CRP/FNR family cyclic AMP-dependent transcriptional regulator
MTSFTIFRNEPNLRSYSAGQTVFRENDPGDFMYAVLEGSVDIIRHGSLLNTILPDGVFGELALIDQQPRSASAIAKTDCVVAVVSEHRFTLMVSHNPHFALEMMRLLTERVRSSLAS